jgi:hypothetical protein
MLGWTGKIPRHDSKNNHKMFVVLKGQFEPHTAKFSHLHNMKLTICILKKVACESRAKEDSHRRQEGEKKKRMKT